MQAFPRSCVFVLSTMLVLSACSRAPERQHVVVSGPLSIEANSSAIVQSPEPMRLPNYWSAICLQPAIPNSLASDGHFGVLAPNGTQFFPKVLLRNSAGVEDSFDQSGQMGGSDGQWLCFESSAPVSSLHAPYIAVVIQSPSNLKLAAVKWHSSDK